MHGQQPTRTHRRRGVGRPLLGLAAVGLVVGAVGAGPGRASVPSVPTARPTATGTARRGPGAAGPRITGVSVARLSGAGVSGAGPGGAGADTPGVSGRAATAGGTAPAPPDIARCEAEGAPTVTECLDPARVRGAYGVTPLIDRGDTGRGQTIVVVDSYGSPTVAHDLRVFDAGYHLAAPPSLRVLAPLGTVRFDPGSATQESWADETTLDVEWSHAMAPGAAIVVLTSPVAETEGTAGLTQFYELERYALDHHLGDVISQSWLATENTLDTTAGRALVRRFEALYARAAADHVTVLAAAGDTGTDNPSNAAGTRYYRQPTVGFPASSPEVTAVGGTALTASGSDRWVSERTWNDSTGAGGGGVSAMFAEPDWQKRLPGGVQRLLHGRRGVPDVAWNASGATAILIYTSFGGEAGWSSIGGTSEGAPQWAGLVADVDQARHAPIGFLNPILYRLPAADFHDITRGTNGYDGVRGYRAAVGWDPTSGLGTPRAGHLAEALVAAR
jgi:subtilase family serine protease